VQLVVPRDYDESYARCSVRAASNVSRWTKEAQKYVIASLYCAAMMRQVSIRVVVHSLCSSKC